MKILIVDDDERRSASLKAYIANHCQVRPDEIYQAPCLTDARDLLRAIYFDALILDVVLPKRRDKKDPHPSIGIGLLQELNRVSNLKKPERIIGVTAHISDVQSFRKEFEQSCNIVVEAPSHSDVWKAQIGKSLEYTGVSKTSRAVYRSKTAVLSVHGIRTFGKWQTRLRGLIERRCEGVAFHTYKFGYFSSLVFLFPFLRNLQAKRMATKMDKIVNDENLQRIFIFCHSFGTYLAANAMKQISEKNVPNSSITLVLCGSVLNSTYDWKWIERFKNIRILNECGSSDYILWISNAFVPGLGMAGKNGFHGFNNQILMNRYHKGGHGLYFEEDEFMLKYWLPLLDENSEISEIDERNNNGVIERLLENLVILLGVLKSWLYGLAALYCIYLVTQFLFE